LKTSKEMQKLVIELCRKMKCNLNSKGAYLKLNLDEGHIPLIIERLTEWTVSVRHEVVSDTGLIMPDPEVIFYTQYDEWVAIESTNPISNAITPGQYGGNRKHAELSSTGKYIKTYDVQEQKNLATYVKSWFNRLKADGWVEFAQDTAYQQGKLDDAVIRGEAGDGTEDESHMVEGELVYAQLPAGTTSTISNLIGE
jgi:hypothetical protein